jgi:hypothetical protein
MKTKITLNVFGFFLLTLLGITNKSIAQTNPTPYNGWPNDYLFNNWSASSSAGTYPANMIFHYADTNDTDPLLTEIIATEDYMLAYNLTSSTRIEGWDHLGFSFVNTSPGHSSDSTGNLGEAVLALNTTARENVQLSWTAGTITTAQRIYKLRAQYRIGTTGAYIDLPYTNLSEIEYTSPGVIDTPGVDFGPIILPGTCDNQSVVQIRWAYYYSGTGSSTRTKINLTNINVSSDASASTGIHQFASERNVVLYPNPVVAGEVLTLSEPVDAVIYDFYGRQVMNVASSSKISTERLSKGIYLLQTSKNQLLRFAVN